MAAGKATMTDRERIEAMLRREKPDRIPIWPFATHGFAVVNAGFTIAEGYNKPEKALEAQRGCCDQYGWVFAPMIGYAAYGGWEFGGEIKWPSGEYDQAPSVARQPVETEEDVAKLKKPDVETAGIIPITIEFNKLSAQERLDNEPFNVLSRGAASAFTIAGNIVGAEKFCRWVMKSPNVVHQLMRLATDFNIETCQYWKDTFGIDGVLPFGSEPISSNQLISPKHFEEFAFPYLKEVNEKALEMGYKHLYVHVCGEQNANLPFWSKIPMGDPGILSFGHEVELETAVKFFPNDIIVGNIDPTIIAFGTPEQVYEAAKTVIEKGKKCSGGFALSPGCQMPPKAPPLNTYIMTKAVNDFGWYD